MEDKVIKKKDFDCVKFVREQRDKNAEMFNKMTSEEIIAYLKKAGEQSGIRTK